MHCSASGCPASAARRDRSGQLGGTTAAPLTWCQHARPCLPPASCLRRRHARVTTRSASSCSVARQTIQPPPSGAAWAVLSARRRLPNRLSKSVIEKRLVSARRPHHTAWSRRQQHAHVHLVAQVMYSSQHRLPPPSHKPTGRTHPTCLCCSLKLQARQNSCAFACVCSSCRWRASSSAPGGVSGAGGGRHAVCSSCRLGLCSRMCSRAGWSMGGQSTSLRCVREGRLVARRALSRALRQQAVGGGAAALMAAAPHSRLAIKAPRHPHCILSYSQWQPAELASASQGSSAWQPSCNPT